jgi:(E)-4-hydroxy-3-methylbut-2-enyl-diphosphate synthase
LIVEWHLNPRQNSSRNLTWFGHAVRRLSLISGNNTFFSTQGDSILFSYRLLAQALNTQNLRSLIHLRWTQPATELSGLYAAIHWGGLLVDGLGHSLTTFSSTPLEEVLASAYTLLQAARSRISKTEFISCPSCGRTEFNLQKTTEVIRAATGHLKGLKIAVMGCIVNGPGEMADADFGYVGTGPKKVSLYVGHNCVKRNIPEEGAVDELIALIKQHNRWTESPVKVAM